MEIFAIKDSILVKLLDYFSYVLSGQKPKKIALKNNFYLLGNVNGKEIEDVTDSHENYSSIHHQGVSETILRETIKAPQRNGISEKSGSMPLVERKYLYSPRKKRTRYTNMQRKKFLLSTGTAPDTQKVCLYLSEARISELLNIDGFTPELVARIYDARRQQKFSTIKEIEERVAGFRGSHLNELYSVINK